MATDYPLVGPPSISEAKFASVLAAAKSPMAGEAASIYKAVQAKGVDPAVILAIAQHESSFGTKGIAVGRDNPFGSRYYAGIPGATNRGGWASFTSWTAAASYTAGLLASPSYAGSKTKTLTAAGARTGPLPNTAFGFAYRYAPYSDHNDPANYGAFIVNAINGWAGSPDKVTARSFGGPARSAATTPAAQAKLGPASPSLKPLSSSTSHLVLFAGVGAGAILLLTLKRKAS